MEIIDRFAGSLLLLKPTIHGDDRGHFLETYNHHRFRELVGRDIAFVQDNESLSDEGVLRGLHLQAVPRCQAKLCHVVRGSVLDICVDVRPESPWFGQHFRVELDGREKLFLFVPEGFAHGFLTRENGTVFSYKCSDYYAPEAERTLLWNDPALGIDWGVTGPVLSGKDRQGVPLSDLDWGGN